jgi:DNA adenine methylase
VKATVPHPIPYQGSKRKLAPSIRRYIPSDIETFYEPFAGSAAVSLYAAHHGLSRHFVIADSLEPIVDLWEAIIQRPEEVSIRYDEIWKQQNDGNPDHYNLVRERFNTGKDPVDLLYLICRCVKNAVRFGGKGHFNQSADRRRRGMHPETMRKAVLGASKLLKGKTELRKGDWLITTADACATDFIYMDPPYLGTSVGRDKRYHQQLLSEPLIEGIKILNGRNIRFLLSYDGMTGSKEYGPALPGHLQLSRIFLNAGKSTQSILQGKSEETIESLYVSENLGAIAVDDTDRLKREQLALGI